MNYVTPVMADSYTKLYEYDENNRLSRETKQKYLIQNEDSLTTATDYTYYEYDSIGNLASKRVAEGTLAEEISVGMKVLKNNPESTVEMYDYDGFNRLSQVRKGGVTAQYSYNAEGIRTSKSINNQKTEFLLDGVNVIGEVSNGSGVTTYLRGVTGLISQKKPDNSKLYYMTNGHGDVTALVNPSGSITKTYTYDAFGVEQNIDPADTNPFRYCGEYFDSETQSIYLRNRYYSAGIGRFTQQDPTMSDGTNWYVYCIGNPVLCVDPTGLSTRMEKVPMMGDIQRLRELLKRKYSEGAQIYIDYYSQQLDSAQTEEEKKHWQSQIDDIKELDKQGKIQGKRLNVPTYNQYDVPPKDGSNNLCWATCIAMTVSYYSNDTTNRTQSIASYTRAFIEGYTGSPMTYNKPFHWVSTDKYYFDLEQSQSQSSGVLDINAIQSTIDNGDPFGVLYGTNVLNPQTNSYEWVGHWVLGIGYASAPGHEPLVVSNDPNGGVMRIQTYSDFCGPYVGNNYGMMWAETAS